MGLLYGTSDSGSVLWPLVFKPNGMQPVDNRTVVGNETDLNIKTTFKDKYYLGMQVYVVENKTLYILTGESDTGVWTKLPSQDDLTKALETNKKELFTFKGVASAIDEDRCTITISGLKINNTTLTVDKQAYDLGMQTMFHWTSGGATPTYEFWTETSDGTGTQYTATASTLVDYLIVQGTYYFKTDTTDVWESVDGVKIYEKSGSYYTDAAYTNSVVGTPGNYTGYQFTQKDPQQTVEAAGTTVKAEREGETANIGHVYQLGEEEYASNGTIWVQLGSPKEDWIVIK